MGVKEAQEIIPHRHPFLSVNCIEELQPGVRVVGYKCVTYDELFFKGHFPQELVIPDVLLIKAPAQIGAVAILSQEGFKGEVAHFEDVEKAKFKRKVTPGNRVKLECEITEQKGPVGVGKTIVMADGKLAMSVELAFMTG